MTFSNAATPTTKLLVQKPILINSSKSLPVKEETPSQMTISLKSEFQKKQQMKLHNPKSKVTVMSANETTWLAQKNRNEITQIPLTPKKTSRSIESPTKTDSKSLSKAQLNEIQIKLGLQRQKIQKNQKITAEKSGKHLEDSKQKVFFQALNKKPLHRRSSLESEDPNNSRKFNNRLSLVLPNEIMENGRKFLNEIDVSENNIENVEINGKDEVSKSVHIIEKLPEKPEIEENNNEMELPQSLQESDVALSPAQITQDQIVEISTESNTDYQFHSVLPSNLKDIPEVSVLEETPISRYVIQFS